MGVRVEFAGWTALLRLAVVGLVASLAAACSSDTARFTGTSVSNPFSSSSRIAEPTVTGSLPQSPAIPTTAIQTQALPPPVAATPLRTPTPGPISLAPPVAAPALSASPAVRTAAASAARLPSGWTAEGGTPVTVTTGDNLNALATRYGVPASAILSANGLSNASQVVPGRQLVIPVFNAAGSGATSAPVAAAPAAVRTASAAPAATLRQVQPAPVTASPAARTPQTTMRLVEGARPNAVPPARTPAPASARQVSAPATQPAAAPQRTAARPAPAAAPTAARPASAPSPARSAEARQPAVSAQPKQTAAAPAPAPAPKPTRVAAVGAAPVPATPAKPEPAAPATTASLPAEASAPAADFRWPARGRVITGFGTNGNEGINIAVPEGTPVKAAESGVVAYAGSELKGYGNLVLIRHDNGYVSAYAHNGELNVKRGDKVKRGQVVARSGQTGNVSSPQLHFEIRRGSSPVDPMPYLNN